MVEYLRSKHETLSSISIIKKIQKHTVKGEIDMIMLSKGRY
jgi:hypothetical protein